MWLFRLTVGESHLTHVLSSLFCLPRRVKDERDAAMNEATKRDVKRETAHPTTKKQYLPPKLVRREKLVEVTRGLPAVVT